MALLRSDDTGYYPTFLEEHQTKTDRQETLYIICVTLLIESAAALKASLIDDVAVVEEAEVIQCTLEDLAGNRHADVIQCKQRKMKDWL